ncbi:MAG: class I SAM-dependent methyltransferase [Verrucomicrobia bacterium]|nr:class I SAM-dependent methyltransferase [Verrucomicrobiota bacterium]
MHPEHYEAYHRLEITHWWSRARRRIFAAAIGRFAPAHRPLRVVDVGCGTGANLAEWEHFGCAIGVDASPLALDYSSSRGGRRLVGAALPALPFRDGSIDVVLALDVLEHVADDAGAARELWRICTPGGLLIATVPAYQWLWSKHDERNQHQRRYTRQQLEACVLGPEAERLRSSYFNTLLAPPVFAARLLGRLRPTSAAPAEDFHDTATWLNKLLENVFASEWAWLRQFSFPYGVSVLCIARKKA